MTPASQRQEPGDPRAKAIEVMARAMYEAAHRTLSAIVPFDRTHPEGQDVYRADARAALAALEQEGLVLTDTRCEACDGQGWEAETVAGCCGSYLRTGECCGNAVPVQEQVPCERCGGSGKALADTHEVQRLREREAHFAKVLGVTDGGQYRNDWDAKLTGLLEEVQRLREALERIATGVAGYAWGREAARDIAREALSSVPAEEGKSNG